MYHAHFGLERSLFGEGIATDAAVFRTPKHDRLIAHYKLALGSPSAVVVLRGPAGVGKTTMTATALRMTSTRLALAWLDGTPTNAGELLELILVELGASTQRTTRIERIQLWRQFQAEMRATDSRLFLVVERTEDLAPEVLHSLDQLTAPDAVGNPGANLVLLGNERLHEHLAAPILDSLRQRIRLRIDLEPLTEAELQDYLRHQVAHAGASYDSLFAPGTAGALYRYSRGVVRLANTLCESALEMAAVQQQKQLTADLVARTAVSLLGLTSVSAAASPPATPAGSAAVRPTEARAAESRPADVRPEVRSAPLLDARPPPLTEPKSDTRQALGMEPRVQPPPAAPPLAAELRPSLAPRPIESGGSKPPAASAAPMPPPTLAPTAALFQPQPVERGFDDGAKDVSDIAISDFPVLTDAVEEPTSTPSVTQSAPAPSRPEPAPLAATVAKPVMSPGTRVETAYAAPPRPPAKPVAPTPTPTSAPRATASMPTSAAPKPVATPAPPPPPPPESDDDDVLRQTQTMRAIAVAKSIDDISSSMAETLFGDDELDLMAAALASAGEWPDDDEPTAAPESEPSVPAPVSSAPAKPLGKAASAKPATTDDPFSGLFDLGDDAPLELIDDSSQPPGTRAPKTAAR